MIPADLSVEYPLVKLPYDCVVKEFKSSKKNVEKEMSSVLNSIIKLKNEENLNKSQAQDTITSLIGRLQSLKRKMNENYTEQDYLYESCRKRIAHLNSITKTKEDQTCYHKNRLNRLMIDYLMREGHVKTAKKLMQEYKIEDLSELEIQRIMESNDIIQDLKNHSCTLAFKWCNSNKSKLGKIKSKFELKLVLQQFIEFVKKGQKNEAIAYIKTKADVTESHLEDLQKAMGCLTYYPNFNKFQGYEYYFQDERWKDLVVLFKKENYKIFSLTTYSQFNISLQFGLSTLKTIYCYNEKYTQPDKCPVCNTIMRKLAEKLPSTLKTVSSLICRISGEIMDEHNPPVMLPNGEVYSQKSIQEMADKNNGIITCPTKKMNFKISEVTKIYLS